MEEGGKQGHNMTKVVGEIFFKDGGYLNMFVSQWFTNFSASASHLEGLLKFRLLPGPPYSEW